MDEEQKTQEQLKAEQFEKNPDDFINVNDCLVVVECKRDEIGKVSHYRMKANIHSEDEMHIAKGRAQMIVDTAYMALLRRKSQEKAIVTPGNGNKNFIPGLRNFLKK